MFPIIPQNQNQPKPTDPGKVATLLTIIVAALVMGCVMFGAFVVFTGAFNKPAKEMQLSLMAAGMALTNTLLSFVIPPIVAQAATRNANGDRPTFLQAYMTKTIIAVALLEGATLFVIFTIMTEHHWWSLAIAVFLVGLMLNHIPSKMRIEQWLDENGAHEDERPVG
ncbi:MAG: hypothetical protein DWH91_09475 [Planctomycetota bacterium]|nr:MAG: hypothetical protein DWH91_09475 [Planctomycetota bacterium]